MAHPVQREAIEEGRGRFDPDAWKERRILVVVAHPDDEVLGCGALLSRLADVTVVHVTDGAPRDGIDARRYGFEDAAAYARARWSEAQAALALAGVPASRHLGLDLSDQSAAFDLPGVTRQLAPLVMHADCVLTHAFEGGHPDHDAVAFAVHAAAALAARDAAEPAVIEMPFYHLGSEAWARQVFLPHGNAGPETALAMSDAERSLKRRMAEAHRTQADVLSGFDLHIERYRRAPRYDFAALPNGGQLLYEHHDWKLSGPQWRELAGRARTDLGLERPA